MSLPATLPMLKNLSPFLTVDQAARKAGVSRITILNDIHKGALHAELKERAWIIQREDFTSYIREQSRFDSIAAFLEQRKEVLFFTPRNLMDLFGVVYTTILRWITRYCYFTAARIFGRIYVTRSSVERFITLHPEKLIYQHKHFR